MDIHLRPAGLDDVAFLADVVIAATLDQGRFPRNINLAEYRAGFEEWSRETVLGRMPDCTLSVIEWDGHPVGRLRVLRTGDSITLAGIQLMPVYQNKGIGTRLIEQLQEEANRKQIPLFLAVEKDNPHARRLYERLGFVLIYEDEQEYHLVYGTSAAPPS